MSGGGLPQRATTYPCWIHVWRSTSPFCCRAFLDEVSLSFFTQAGCFKHLFVFNPFGGELRTLSASHALRVSAAAGRCSPSRSTETVHARSSVIHKVVGLTLCCKRVQLWGDSTARQPGSIKVRTCLLNRGVEKLFSLGSCIRSSDATSHGSRTLVVVVQSFRSSHHGNGAQQPILRRNGWSNSTMTLLSQSGFSWPPGSRRCRDFRVGSCSEDKNVTWRKLPFVDECQRELFAVVFAGDFHRRGFFTALLSSASDSLRNWCSLKISPRFKTR